MSKGNIKRILNRVYKPLLKRYLDKERNYIYDGLKLKIAPGVFHPGFFFSTKILIGYLKNIDLKNKTVLELGAGSGLISLVAAKKGARVTASDISRKALKNILFNQQANHVDMEIIHSDLFQNIPKNLFDVIVINPPYFKGITRNEDDYAWYAGEDFEYFQNLFLQLSSYIHDKTKTVMILSDDCDIKKIESIASSKHFKFHMVYSKKIFWETNFVFEIKKYSL